MDLEGIVHRNGNLMKYVKSNLLPTNQDLFPNLAISLGQAPANREPGLTQPEPSCGLDLPQGQLT